ncbi:hypothetical protein BCE75_101380 [Isoptericola sp. CG 20/1183]|uniref:ESAT-6 protein secretion system EspG family protein n=1 Tax=Isoptericola halotolerans TaxID=300560 RepID=A0ABX5EG73_9MICO|nr:MULTISPECIES: hypothetical protein [Isoptericola]PRZ08500.1 hypothetical protein BCL65_10242 [Isoptericola halotolerans]PRZ11053.1 hypothetical protein BCE75_101380 [Isoptericola sp. CG 20/1183]
MTLRVDFDTDRWVYVPEAFPWNGYPDEDEWAGTVAHLAAEAFEYTADEQTALRRMLDALLAYPRMLEGMHRFALLGTPDKGLEMVQVVDAPTSPETTEERMLGLPDPDATREPQVTDVVGGLGSGRRAVRYTRADALEGEIVVSVNWAWRAGGRDVVVMYGTSNLVQLDALLPVLDEFAASIRLAD